MSLESRKEKLFYRAFVPIGAGVIGALAAVVFSGDSCQLGPGTDFLTILRDSGLSGPEKMKALELYSQITDRPWGIVRTLMTILVFTVSAWIGYTSFGRR